MSVLRQFSIAIGSCAALITCTGPVDHLGDLPPNVHQKPVYTPLNTAPGYSIHPLKSDTIKPQLKPSGDTLITGVPVELKGNILASPMVQKKIGVAGLPNPIDSKNPVVKIPKPSKIILVDAQNVQSFPPSSAKMRDTVFLAKFVDVPSSEPPSTPASLPKFKDSFSQNIRYLDVAQGMNSSRVRTVLQDQRGHLWFGTHGGGATKYDGERFSFYTAEHGLNDNIVTSMYEDSKGNLWFGTWVEGISLFNGLTFLDFSANDWFESPVNAITEDRQGNIWIGSWDGIFRFNGSELTCYTHLAGNPLRISSIIVGDSGELWFGTMTHGILSYNGKEFTQYTTKESLNSNTILSILEDRNGNLWLGTSDQGLCMFDGNLFTYYGTPGGSANKVINILLEDQQGNIWIGTDGDGIIKFDGENFTHITRREGLSDNSILSILEDHNAQIWVGTNDGGVSVIKSNSFVHLTSLESVNASNVRSIREDGQGNHWFATWGGGVIVKKGQQLVQYTTEHGLPSNVVWDMIIDNQGLKWFGGEGGLTSFDGAQFVNYPLPNHILSLLEDRSGTIWIGTAGMGLLRYDGERFLQYSTREGFNGDNIWSITEDSQGNLWIATWGGAGVAKYDGTHFTFYTEQEGLIHNDIWSVIEDHGGNIWLGSYGEGISVFDGNGFTSITDQQGLPNNIISSIIEDPNGDIWVGTEKGLSRFDIDPVNHNSYRLINYSSHDGLIAEDFNVHSVYLDSQDKLWWGTGKSLVTLDLTTQTQAYPSSEVTLEQVDIGGAFMDHNQVAPFTNLPAGLVIPFKQNHLTFHFTANDHLTPHKNLYSYLMPAVSKQWSKPSSEAKADYRNIPYGEHRFLISTTNKAMEWSVPFEYSFTVLPPWWQTWWAQASYLLLGIAGITGIIRWRTANIKQRQRELERTVQERTAEVVAQQKRSDELLLNILPVNVAEELKETGKIEPVHFEEVSILFADFKEFTNIVASIPSKKLITELNDIFQSFDDIMERRGLEKIQTVGDAYVAAGGLPNPDPEHASKCVVAASDMIEYLSKRNETSSIKWNVRIGIHSGPITAGVVGKKKFTYDVFGDTVNVAARIESASDEGRINVSAYTHDLIKNHFDCEYRGKIKAKGKGDLDMYFVTSKNE